MNQVRCLEFAKLFHEAILVISAEGIILEANLPALKMFSSKRDEICGKNLVELTSDPKDKVEQYMQAWAKNRLLIPGSLSFKLNNEQTIVCRTEGGLLYPRIKDSSPLILVRLKLRETTINNFVALNQNLEKLRIAHRKLAKKNEQLEHYVKKRTEELNQRTIELKYQVDFGRLISYISSEFINLRPEEIDNGIEKALKTIGKFTGVDLCYVFQFQNDNKKINNTHTWCAEEILPKCRNIKDFDIDIRLPFLSEKIRSFDMFYAPDITNLSDELDKEKQHFQIQNIQSTIIFPMFSSNNLMGFLEIDSVLAKREWSAEHIALIKIVGELFVNALKRKHAEFELDTIHKKLQEVSRYAGMAEIATGVLHNVGNALNSVNVSTTLISDKIRNSKILKLSRTIDLIHEHNDDLVNFIANDEKGKLIPDYLIKLSEQLLNERTSIVEELVLLRENIEHIKEIVSAQQSYAKKVGVLEIISAADIVEDAIHINGAALQRHGINLKRDYSSTPNINIEKHKVIQILINLIRNAKYALDDGSPPEKILTLRISMNGDSQIKIEVIDNGIGIAKENLTRIFANGFTTRKEGLGFGLHIAALTAVEMGASLTAFSDGLGTGAVFTLLLPVQEKANQTGELQNV